MQEEDEPRPDQVPAPPVGKDQSTPADEDLDEDQATLQTDNEGA